MVDMEAFRLSEPNKKVPKKILTAENYINELKTVKERYVRFCACKKFILSPSFPFTKSTNVKRLFPVLVNSASTNTLIQQYHSGSRYLVVFPDNEKLEEYVQTSSNDFRAAVVFEGDDKNITYTIRYQKRDAWHWGKYSKIIQ